MPAPTTLLAAIASKLGRPEPDQKSGHLNCGLTHDRQRYQVLLHADTVEVGLAFDEAAKATNHEMCRIYERLCESDSALRHLKARYGLNNAYLTEHIPLAGRSHEIIAGEVAARIRLLRDRFDTKPEPDVEI